MVEEILSMQTGNHVLDAFNLDYDSFIDNITFAAVIDRVGSTAHHAEGVRLPPHGRQHAAMLREEGVPSRGRRDPAPSLAKKAAEGDPCSSR